MEQGAQSLPSPPLLEAFREYRLGFKAYDTGRGIEEGLSHLLHAYDLDTTFVLPLVLGSHWAWYVWDDAKADSLTRFVEARRHLLDRRSQFELDYRSANRRGPDRQAALRAAREMARLDPMGYSPINYSNAARWANLPREAIEALQTYDPSLEWRRDEAVDYWYALGISQHMLGEHEQELVSVRQGRERYPKALDMFEMEIQALAALHRPDEVMGLLDQAPALFPDPTEAARVAGQELRAHGHAEAAVAAFQRGIEWFNTQPSEEVDREELALTLYCSERWGEANALFRVLASERPEDLGLLGWVGRSAARMGDTAAAREISEQIAEMPRPEQNYRHLEGRAYIAALLGQPDEAMRLLREAESRGMAFTLSLHREMDLESLHQREDFQEFIRPKG